MLLPRLITWAFAVGTMVLGTDMVCAQNYPTKPIRIVTSGVGGGNDFAARLIAQGLSVSPDWQVVVDNRGALIAIETVAKAPPDGYALLVAGSSFAIGALMQNTPYDPLKDFSPVTLAAISPTILVVHPSVPVKSVKDLIALAKARPGQLNYASSGTGGATHLTAELFNSMAGVNIVRINYKGAGMALNDLLGGQVQLAFATVNSVTPHVKFGRLRALAVTSAKPSALFPGLPTVTASGLPGYESSTMTTVSVPARTPVAIINRLNQEIVQVLRKPDSRERLLTAGVDVVGSSPDELAAAMKLEMARLGKVIKDADIRAE